MRQGNTGVAGDGTQVVEQAVGARNLGSIWQRLAVGLVMWLLLSVRGSY